MLVTSSGLVGQLARCPVFAVLKKSVFLECLKGIVDEASDIQGVSGQRLDHVSDI